MVTVLYPEAMYPDDTTEREIFGPETRILLRDTRSLAELSDADCAETDGLMIFRHFVSAADLARFPRLRAIVRMGVGYDRIDRPAAAQRNVLVCNIPDYGTTEVADHAIALALTLRRGLLLHHEAQRRDPPAPWLPIEDPLLRRLSVQTFGVVGLGRIGTAGGAASQGARVPGGVLRPVSPERDRSGDRRRPRTDPAGAVATSRCPFDPRPPDAAYARADRACRA